MGKKGPKTSGSGLGRSIIKDRFAGKGKSTKSLLHTSELEDGQDWNRINLMSITEQTDVDDFLSTAELANTEFQAEKLNIKFVPQSLNIGILTASEKTKIENAQRANKENLRIPRRPPWDVTTTAEELLQAERDSFLVWRRSLAQLQEVDGITLTPFEKNLEFWRQLWRVIERSDVVVQIVDARNPLMFRCEDLEAYVKEVNQDKDNLLLVNKSDFLTDAQREVWAKYFREKNMKAVFFSALVTEEEDIEEEEEKEKQVEEEEQEEESSLDHPVESGSESIEECRKDLENLSANLKADDSGPVDAQEQEPVAAKASSVPCFLGSDFVTSSHLLSRTELIEVFQTIYTKKRVSGKAVTIGLVGYPNVGKSSTINCLLEGKKVSVSATPGKTKHFQTLYLTEDVILCDCPGLVFPAFVSTKEEMIVSGILPIDQMRDAVPPINLVASRIPREVFETTYGIKLPPPIEGEDPNRPPTSEELLNSYGFMRGYMTARGQPDNPRTARYVLKDYMNGKLLYAHAPPNVNQLEYHTPVSSKIQKPGNAKLTPQQMKTLPYQVRPEALDQKFFAAKVPSYHVKDPRRPVMPRGPVLMGSDGPKRQKNMKKKEKLRRRFAHLDE